RSQPPRSPTAAAGPSPSRERDRSSAGPTAAQTEADRDTPTPDAAPPQESTTHPGGSRSAAPPLRARRTHTPPSRATTERNARGLASCRQPQRESQSSRSHPDRFDPRPSELPVSAGRVDHQCRRSSSREQEPILESPQRTVHPGRTLQQL